MRISPRKVLNILASRGMIPKSTILIARISTYFIGSYTMIIKISYRRSLRLRLLLKRYLDPIYIKSIIRPLSQGISFSRTLAILD